MFVHVGEWGPLCDSFLRIICWLLMCVQSKWFIQYHQKFLIKRKTVPVVLTPNCMEERFREQCRGGLVALRAARTSYAVFLPNVFRIKSSFDKDNDSCSADVWRGSLTRGFWVQACLRKRNILRHKTQSYCLYQPSVTEEVEKGIMNKVLIHCVELWE